MAWPIWTTCSVWNSFRTDTLVVGKGTLLQRTVREHDGWALAARFDNLIVFDFRFVERRMGLDAEREDSGLSSARTP